MKRINEIVVVEGKTDSQLLKELYDVDTIETHGLGLDDKTLELIKEASKTRGVIVLTDPDYLHNKNKMLHLLPHQFELFFLLISV